MRIRIPPPPLKVLTRPPADSPQSPPGPPRPYLPFPQKIHKVKEEVSYKTDLTRILLLPRHEKEPGRERRATHLPAIFLLLCRECVTAATFFAFCTPAAPPPPKKVRFFFLRYCALNTLRGSKITSPEKKSKDCEIKACEQVRRGEFAKSFHGGKVRRSCQGYRFSL